MWLMKSDLEHTCRPFTGAWIETTNATGFIVGCCCRPFTGAWIETRALDTSRCISTVAPSRGRGLKRICPAPPHLGMMSPLHGGVD